MNRPRKPARPEVTRAIGYIRVSTAAQAESGAGLEHQRQAVTAEIEHRGWVLVDVIPDEGKSGCKAPDERPGLGKSLEMLDSGRADALVALKVDRVSRSTLDFAKLAERADARGWALVTMDVPIDPKTPIGKATRNMLSTFAQLERDFISQRTAEALAIKAEQGVKIGRARTADPEAIKLIRALRAAGLGWPKTARQLNADDVPTAQGGKWFPMTCKRLAEDATR
jgi:DNA invertase Pin-like site-specific DNA recombinase